VPKLVLSDLVPIAKGSIRDVYRHPDNPGLLIKVIRKSTQDEKFGSGRRWYKASKRRYRHLISYLREIREHIAVNASDAGHPDYLQNIVGFAETDLGLGLVVEAIFAPDGSYAPTLSKLIAEGQMTPEIQEAFERFCRAVTETEVIIADLHVHNVVYGSPDGDDPRFILIDGVGHKTLVPLELVSQRINRWSNSKKIEKLRASVAARSGGGMGGAAVQQHRRITA
jgi:hypothetical protein